MNQSRSAAFLLKQDLRENRPWRLYVNGNRLVQANGTNPRISQVSPTEALTISATSDRVIELLYKARVVKQGINPALMLPTNHWQISFDGGATLFDCRVQAPIREKGVQDDAWLVFLERSNRATGLESVSEILIGSEQSEESQVGQVLTVWSSGSQQWSSGSIPWESN